MVGSQDHPFRRFGTISRTDDARALMCFPNGCTLSGLTRTNCVWDCSFKEEATFNSFRVKEAGLCNKRVEVPDQSVEVIARLTTNKSMVQFYTALNGEPGKNNYLDLTLLHLFVKFGLRTSF